MIRNLLPLICVALGLAAASCGQSEGPFAPAEAPASPQGTSHDAASAAMASPASNQAAGGASNPADPPSDQDPLPQDAPPPPASPAASSQSAADASPNAPTTAPAERRASTLIGLLVVSAHGSPLGEVKDIIFDRQGRATHLVIAYGSSSQANPEEIPNDGGTTLPPDGKLTAMPWDAAMATIKNGRLVLDDAQLNGAPTFTADAWPNLDDPSWSAATDAYWRKAVQAAIAAHPGAPIDSTARQRERRSRDGED
jgi:sporulation protein YlmC with PRC-barrel domain